MNEAPWVVLHAGALGDLVLTLHIALRLPEVSRQGRLHVISRSHPGDLAICRPAVTRESADGLGLHALYREHADIPDDIAERLRGRRVLSALGDTESAVHRQLNRLRPRVLYSLDPRPRPGIRRHITEQWRQDLESHGLLIPKCVHQRPQLRALGVPDALRRRGAEVLCAAGANPDAVIVHAGSGGREKCWPAACFRSVAEHLSAQGLSVCFLVGPVELEWWSDADLCALTDGFPTLRLPGPRELSAALAAARAVVANDSGPAHLAALLGTPTTVVFGPTSAAVWRPLGPSVRVLERQRPARDWGIDPTAVAASVSAPPG